MQIDFPLDFPPKVAKINIIDNVTECHIISDVHGCFTELCQLLCKLGYEEIISKFLANQPLPNNLQLPKIIFVGDLVDRGEGVLQTLKLVIQMCKNGLAMCVMGNHDWKFFKWLLGKEVEIKHGIDKSIAQLQSLIPVEQKILRGDLIQFFINLPFAVRLDNQSLTVAHAAWHNGLLTGSAGEVRAYTMYGPVTGKKTPEGYSERIDWAKNYNENGLVVFGHQVYKTPYINPHAIGIDTGCVYGGWLTSIHYPSLKLTQVKSKFVRCESKRLAYK